MRTLLIIYYVYATYGAYRAAFDKVSGDVIQKVDALASRLNNPPNITATPSGSSSASGSDPGAISQDELILMLARAERLPPLDQTDFPNHKHWLPTLYRQLRKGGTKAEVSDDSLLDLGLGTSSSGKKVKSPPILSCFLEDKDGNPIPETERKEILSTAKGYWEYLFRRNKAPETSRKKTIDITIQWRTLMESNFSCFRYCDNHWKSEQLWINYYPS